MIALRRVVPAGLALLALNATACAPEAQPATPTSSAPGSKGCDRHGYVELGGTRSFVVMSKTERYALAFPPASDWQVDCETHETGGSAKRLMRMTSEVAKSDVSVLADPLTEVVPPRSYLEGVVRKVEAAAAERLGAKFVHKRILGSPDRPVLAYEAVAKGQGDAVVKVTEFWSARQRKDLTILVFHMTFMSDDPQEIAAVEKLVGTMKNFVVEE